MKFDMQSLLEQAQKVQQDLEIVKKKSEESQVSAESGGGLVKVTMKGNFQLTSLTIDKSIIDPNDTEMMEDLIIAAVNAAVKDAKSMVDDQMKSAMGPLGQIPGMNF